MITVDIKELKNRLSHYLREIKGGEKIAITEREVAEFKKQDLTLRHYTNHPQSQIKV